MSCSVARLMFTPQLIALDVDGTIVGQDDLVPPQIIAKLRQIDAAGLPVVLVTGRSWLAAQIVLDQLGLPLAYCVCNNGATIVEYPPLRVIGQTTFDPAPIVAAVRDHPSLIMAVEEFGRGYRLSAPFPPGIYELVGQMRVVGWDELAAQPASRLILRDIEASPEQFAAMVASLDLTSFWSALGGENWLDVASAEAGKDKGLALVAARLGIDQADVLALGDSYNDIELLAWAGRGVALGGAPPQLLAVADAVTGSFDEQGVLSELTRWFAD